MRVAKTMLLCQLDATSLRTNTHAVHLASSLWRPLLVVCPAKRRSSASEAKPDASLQRGWRRSMFLQPGLENRALLLLTRSEPLKRRGSCVVSVPLATAVPKKVEHGDGGCSSASLSADWRPGSLRSPNSFVCRLRLASEPIPRTRAPRQALPRHSVLRLPVRPGGPRAHSDEAGVVPPLAVGDTPLPPGVGPEGGVSPLAEPPPGTTCGA